MENNIVYHWKAYSTDGAFEDESIRDFETEKEAYEDMRNAALEKMKWNTEYDEDFDTDGFDGTVPIDYEVKFYKRKIVHESYSGIYIYEIFDNSEDVKTNTLTTKELLSEKVLGNISDGCYQNIMRRIIFDSDTSINWSKAEDIIYDEMPELKKVR